MLLALPACRPAPAAPATATTPPPATGPSSILAGFDGKADPVADEATTLAEGPLAQSAEREAPGMQLEGDLIAGKLAPGQVIEQEFRLQPGRCYTLIAVGGEGVSGLSATLEALVPVRGAQTVLARGTSTGASAVVGGGGTCFTWDKKEPAQAKFVLRASQGEGVVVSQLYARGPT